MHVAPINLKVTKNFMQKQPQTLEDLQGQLNDQIEFLKSSAESFDAGKIAEAKRMAVAIRVLVHDTGASKSLLGQLGRMTMKFFNSSLLLDEENLMPYSGLVLVQQDTQGHGEYLAMLDDTPQVGKWVDFGDWWNTPVFIDLNQSKLTRKDLVLTMANQDGGAHVDPAIEGRYADISRNSSMGHLSQGNEEIKSLANPELVAVRQIAHECLKSCISGYKKMPVIKQDVFIIGGVSMKSGIHLPDSEKMIAKSIKVGRNEACPCGSGNKYKKCCGAI